MGIPLHFVSCRAFRNNLTTAIPTAAITSAGGNDFIFVQSEGKKLSCNKIQIKKGITNGNYTAITSLSYLPSESKIVINGAFYLIAILTNTGEEEE